MPDTNTIGRTITITRVVYTKGGTAKKKYKDAIVGKADKEKAQRILRKNLRDSSIVVQSVTHDKKHYVMNALDFIENARVTRSYAKGQ